MTDIRPDQSTELLRALHILTRDGKLNQDSRRKLKQIYHLYSFIEPVLKDFENSKQHFNLVDHGAGKSYLGFILYDLFFKQLSYGSIFSIETRAELVSKSQDLAKKCGFDRMYFYPMTVEESLSHPSLPTEIDIVTALHACNTATDDAIAFALQKKAKHIILIPCCQSEVASVLKTTKPIDGPDLYELWRRPLHCREFGAHLTNVLRVLQLQAHGYTTSVTELVGFEHSMKNELISARFNPDVNKKEAKERLSDLLVRFHLPQLKNRFFVP